MRGKWWRWAIKLVGALRFGLLSLDGQSYEVDGEITNTADKGEALYQTLTNRGKVTDFTKQPDGAWEIWLRLPISNIQTGEQSFADVAYYFFRYDNGIVEV